MFDSHLDIDIHLVVITFVFLQLVASRQVVSFASLNSFPAYVEQTSVKNRLGLFLFYAIIFYPNCVCLVCGFIYTYVAGIKLDGQQGRFDGNLDNTLLINNIPPSLNTISSINQQFSKFGTITNIQVF